MDLWDRYIDVGNNMQILAGESLRPFYEHVNNIFNYVSDIAIFNYVTDITILK